MGAPTPLPVGPSQQVGLDVAEIVARDEPWEKLAGKRVLVTGAGGMLPAYTVWTLLGLNDSRGLGIEVVGMVRSRDRAARNLGRDLGRSDFTLIEHDVSQPLELDGPLDHVVHGASAARPSLHAVDPVGTIRANLQGTFNLLDACVAHDGAGFTIMSSAEVYGVQPEGVELIGEDDYGRLDPLNPRASYSEGKRAAETICAAYHAQHRIHITVARFGHIYGPGMALDDGRVQADFARNVIEGNDILLNSDGSAMRTYTYVADAVAGMFTAMLRGEPTAYNIADSRGMTSIRDLAGLFTRTRPEKGLTVTFGPSVDPSTFSPSKRQGLASDRLEALGWRPIVDLPDGLSRFVTHHEQTAPS
jgi:UDP-glucuronate decarboxylase